MISGSNSTGFIIILIKFPKKYLMECFTKNLKKLSNSISNKRNLLNQLLFNS